MSKQTSTVTGTVIGVTRHGHTVWGNPMMTVRLDLSHIDDVIVGGADRTAAFRISNDASVVYAIENPEFRDELHTFALTAAGRISHVIR